MNNPFLDMLMQNVGGQMPGQGSPLAQSMFGNMPYFNLGQPQSPALDQARQILDAQGQQPQQPIAQPQAAPMAQNNDLARAMASGDPYFINPDGTVRWSGMDRGGLSGFTGSGSDLLGRLRQQAQSGWKPNGGL